MVMLTDGELLKIGVKIEGAGARVSDKASIYNAGRIRIGANSRVDDFCVLSAGSGGIKLGSYVHLGVGCILLGDGEIVFEDFSSMSAGGKIYSASDDFSGEVLTNPTVPLEYRKVTSRPVRVGSHVIIGAGSIILPGVTLGPGSAVGAMSLVTGDVAPGIIVAGIPARRVGERSTMMFELERQLRTDHSTTLAEEI